MNLITKINSYINKNNIDIAFVIVIVGLVLSTVIDYLWIISIIASLFIKEDNKKITISRKLEREK